MAAKKKSVELTRASECKTGMVVGRVMKNGDIAVLWNAETGIGYRPLGEVITRNALCILEGEDLPADALLAVQPTLEEARTFGSSFGKRLKEKRSEAERGEDTASTGQGE